MESVVKERSKWSFFLNQKFLLVAWLLCAVTGVVLKYLAADYNNYLIFTGVFNHFVSQTTLYGLYPGEYFDMNHYGVVFAFLIAPFAAMPDFIGMLLWILAGTAGLYCAITALPIDRKWQSVILLLGLNELYTAVAYFQFNIATVALIIFTFTCIEKRREGWAALLILVGFFVKIYGIVGLAFFFFVKRKLRFTVFFVVWSVILFVLPMVFSGPEYVIEQYRGWIEAITSKNDANMFAYFQNISLLGVVRKISGDANYSDMLLIGSGLVLFALSYLRFGQYKNLNFRLMMLSSILLFITLFSSGSEGCTYIIAITGVGVWLSATPVKRGWLTWTLIGLVLFASFAGNLLPTQLYREYWITYALKAVPFALVWLRVCYEMLFCNFAVIEKQ